MILCLTTLEYLANHFDGRKDCVTANQEIRTMALQRATEILAQAAAVFPAAADQAIMECIVGRMRHFHPEGVTLEQMILKSGAPDLVPDAVDALVKAKRIVFANNLYVLAEIE